MLKLTSKPLSTNKVKFINRIEAIASHEWKQFEKEKDVKKQKKNDILIKIQEIRSERKE